MYGERDRLSDFMKYRSASVTLEAVLSDATALYPVDAE